MIAKAKTRGFSERVWTEPTEPVGTPLEGSAMLRDYCCSCGKAIRVGADQIGHPNGCHDHFANGKRRIPVKQNKPGSRPVNRFALQQPKRN